MKFIDAANQRDSIEVKLVDEEKRLSSLIEVEIQGDHGEVVYLSPDDAWKMGKYLIKMAHADPS
jgi:hypothetical protein